MSKPSVGIAVDGSCINNPGKGEYRGVDLKTGRILFISKTYDDATNNCMEFLAVVHAIGYCKQHNMSVPIYSDSQTARAWVRNGRCGSSHITSNQELQQVIDRANEFLRSNPAPKIETWITREWGESKADFGRKSAWSY